MVTSANLSKQAWGDVLNKKDEIWIQSWEAGVVVWPALYKHGGEGFMVPVFGRDLPGDVDGRQDNREEGESEGGSESGSGSDSDWKGKTVVGVRMPYDLPLAPYAAEERPWCASMRYEEVDRFGRSWGGY